MKIANLGAKNRMKTGSRATWKVRAGGYVPAVIYGLGAENRNLALPEGEFTKHVLHHHKLFEIELDDGTKEEAFLKDLQWDEIEDRILHADLLRIELGKPMKAQVPIQFVGHAKGLSHDGLFDAPHPAIQVECLPRDLPEEIKLVINDLDVGQAIHVKDLEVPEGVRILDDPETVVCHCRARGRKHEEEEGAEGSETAETVETADSGEDGEPSPAPAGD